LSSLSCGTLSFSRAGDARAADALTQHYNNARTGATLDETMLNTTTVSAGSFGKLWTLFADGQISAQPLYVPALNRHDRQPEHAARQGASSAASDRTWRRSTR
jgi:hypothetical protein